MWICEPGAVPVPDSGTGFLLLAWAELFDDYTPDSFQPRLYDVPSLVFELRDVSERACKEQRLGKYAQWVREELSSVLAVEADFIEKMPGYGWSLRKLIAVGDLKESATLAKTLECRHNEYRCAAFSALREGVTRLPRAKEAALRALRRVATIVIQAGRIAAEARALITAENLSKTPKELAELVIAFAQPTATPFRCYFSLTGEMKYVQSIARKIRFNPVGRKEMLKIPGGQEFRDATADSLYVKLDAHTDCLVPTEASGSAVRHLRRAVNILNFLSNTPRLEIHPKCLVIDEENHWTIIPLGEQALRRLRPRHDAVERTQSILESIPAERLGGRLMNALEHCSLAQTSVMPRVQLANLWSAVECLAGVVPGKSILDKVENLLIPILVWRRTEKILRYCAIQLQRLQRAPTAQSLGEGFIENRHYVSPESLFLVLTKPTGHPHLLQLFRFAGENPLLVNRLLSLWELFHDPKGLATRLHQTRQSLRWQLARIYRARNLIVHEGVESKQITPLLDHLHYYFSESFSRVLDGLRLHPGWNVEESATWWRLKCEYIEAGLKDFPEKLRVSDFFHFDILGSRHVHAEDHLWGAPVANKPTVQVPPKSG